MENVLLKDYTEAERGAYLGAIASIATADHQATEEELAFIDQLADAAALDVSQKEMVMNAARNISTDELNECLAVLKTSELRFSLITDLIAFAESDGHYSDQEKAGIERIATELNINHEQFELLDEYVQKSPAMSQSAPEEDPSQHVQGFMQKQGLTDKFNKAGINMGSITKGLIGIAGPMILSRLLSGRGGRGGMFGGGGMMGGGRGGGLLGGGLGSIISMLSGGRGFGNAGGLLGRLFR